MLKIINYASVKKCTTLYEVLQVIDFTKFYKKKALRGEA